MKLVLLLATSYSAANAFLVATAPRATVDARSSAVMSESSMTLHRRTFIASALAPAFTTPAAVLAASSGKVVIFGGSGYVGAYATQMLLQQNYDVVSVSRKTAAEQADKVKGILGASPSGGVTYESLDALTSDLSGVLKGATAVISCVGIAPGGSNQRDGNGKVNARIADAVKAAGIDKFVYIGVASELSGGPIKFIFGDYVKGKAEAVSAVKKDFGASALILQPGIIAGAPPGEIRPPGPPGMTPVAVEAVAKAAVAGALGQKSGVVDGNDAIAAAANAL